MIQTGGFFAFRAIAAEAMISAPPPSDTMQHSSRCNGSAIMRDSITSATEISRTPTNSRSVIALTASGLRIACTRVATEISASCSEVVP